MFTKIINEHPAILLSIVLFVLCSFGLVLSGVQAAQKIKAPAYVAPNGSGTNGAGTNFTIEAGRGTGSGTPGDLILYTSTVGSSGTTLQTSTERARIKGTGYIGIGTNAPTGYLDVNADVIRIRTAKVPASATAAGNAGEICWGSAYVYVCIATNTWVRGAIATW